MAVHEQLNRQLDQGEQGRTLVAWLSRPRNLIYPSPTPWANTPQTSSFQQFFAPNPPRAPLWHTLTI